MHGLDWEMGSRQDRDILGKQRRMHTLFRVKHLTGKAGRSAGAPRHQM